MRHLTSRAVLAVGAIFAGTMGFPASAQNPGILRASCGNMQFTYTYDHGATLQVFGIPVITESAFWIVNPTWTEHYFGGDLQKDLIPTATVEPFEGGKMITLHFALTEKEGTTKGHQVFVLRPDNTFTQSVEFTFTRNVEPRTPAVFEWNPTMLNATLFAAERFSAIGPKGRTEGWIPRKVHFEEDATKHPIVEGFQSLHLNSLFGPVNIEATGNTGIEFLDYRKGQWADPNRPTLWLGAHEVPVQFGKSYSYSIRFHFPSALPRHTAKAPAIQVSPSLERVDNALSPNWGHDYIIPTPKSLTYSFSTLPLSNRTHIYLGPHPAPGIRKAVQFLLKDLKDLYDIEPVVIKGTPPDNAPPRGSILIGAAPGYSLPSTLCAARGLYVPLNDEGYCVLVGDRFACVAGRAEMGAFYGITTLLQLIKVNDSGVYLQGARIADYPAMKFRGIHHFTGPHAGNQIARAVRTLMARFKINHFIWQCERIKWKSHPELWSKDYGMSIDDAKKVIVAARDNFVELIPLIESLSHSQWMFANKQHLELADNPAKPDAYDPLNSDTLKIVFDVYQEAIDLFHPKYLHIGHDEVFFRDRLAYLNKDPHKLTDVIMGDTLKIYNWLRQRGVRTMLWGDMFLYNNLGLDACNAPSALEAKRRRDLLPKDVVITDWHYEQHEPQRFKSLQLLQNEGFQVIGSSWFRPPNIATLAAACADFHTLGFLKTTWAGYNFQIDKNPDAWIQYGNEILAAQYAWTGKATPPEDLPFNFRETFQDLWNRRKPVMEKRPGVVVDLSRAYNLQLDDGPTTAGWTATGTAGGLATFPLGQTLFGETRFLVHKNAKGQAAVLFNGLFNPHGEYPSSIEIPFRGIRCGELHFLITASRRTGMDSNLGSVTLLYADKTESVHDLIYGKNIFAWDDLRVGDHSRLAWKGRTRLEGWAQVNDWTLKNPSPGKELDAILVQSSARESAPILLAVTAVDSGASE